MEKKVLGCLVAAVALCAGADEARVRHMADTYLQSDGTQYIDTGYIGSTNLRVEVVFEPVLTNSTRYLFGSASNGAGNSPMKYGLYVQNGGISFTSGTGAGGPLRAARQEDRGDVRPRQGETGSARRPAAGNAVRKGGRVRLHP